MVGQTISHYRILELLGGGGMGIVYKAIDLRLNRPVALKFLGAELTRDAAANERFRHEAQAASALDHPNICTIHEIDETPDHRLFIALAYYEGETLKKRLERGPLPVDAALDIAIQIAQGLSRAHQSGLVHRDIKPANVMITADGLVKIVDFGLAKLTGDADMTRTGTTIGTVAYMSPEQARGEVVDGRTDVWALGVVLYEMLAGARPFTGKDEVAVLASILDHTPAPIGEARPDIAPDLQRIVTRALDKSPASRYRSATELLADLTACRAAMSESTRTATDVLRILRRPVIAIPVAAILLLAAVPAVLAYRRAARLRWAREEAIPQIVRLAEADDYLAAFALAKKVELDMPEDAILAGLWSRFSSTGSLVTTPDGADVYVQPYAASGDGWDYLGRTPLKSVRLARGAFRFRIEKEGFERRLLAARNPGNLLGNTGSAASIAARTPTGVNIRLVRKGPSAAAMVAVPGGAFPVGLTGFNSDNPVAIDEFAIDRLEVTNRQFKEFIDRGGYASRVYWTDLPFIQDGRAIPLQEAIRQFGDSTSRPGPAGWELGEYPAGQADYPVSGVSWFEAVAFCRAAGQTLPTIFHWARAALSPVEIGSPLAPSIIPWSNFAGKGLAAVGSFRGLGPYGTYDMAGNAREWVWNEAADGRRWTLGGGWNDPDYMFTVPNSLPPFDRSPANGFRCAQYQGTVPPSLLARTQTYSRDHRSAHAVSDEVFQVFKRQYAYVKSPLNDRVDARDTSAADWVRETISFDAGYESDRVAAYLFLPKNVRPPYQLVVFFPGVGPFGGRASSRGLQPVQNDYIVKSGRAFVYPVFKGSYERWDPFISLHGEEYLRTFRTRIFQWRQDLGRVLDVLSGRKDVDPARIAYYGASFGASTAFPLIALEDRLKAAVLGPAGFTYREMPPEADAINYVSRVTIPVLMMGGRNDYIFPLETSQKPMFERLGTPVEHKRHVVFDAGHANFPRSEMIREVLAWLDRYLGPVAPATATP